MPIAGGPSSRLLCTFRIFSFPFSPVSRKLRKEALIPNFLAANHMPRRRARRARGASDGPVPHLGKRHPGALPRPVSWFVANAAATPLAASLRTLSDRCEEEHLTEPSSAQTLQRLDVESLATTLEESFREENDAVCDLPCEEEHLTELSSAQTLQRPDVEFLATTLEESFREENDAVCDLPCEEEHLTELSSAQTLQRPDVESLATTLEESCQEENDAVCDLPLIRVGETTSAQEALLFADKSMYPYADLPTFELFEGTPNPVETVFVTELPEESSDTDEPIDVSPASGRCLFSLSIRLRREFDWGLTFYIRVDLLGSYHTYPFVGGPFQSLQEANDAIDRYLEDRWNPTMCLEPHEIPLLGKAHVDYVIRQSIYWPDGKRKMRLKSEPIDESRCWRRQLVKALVDKYNEDFNVLEEFKALVLYQTILEGDGIYYHINFTTKNKGAHESDRDRLFFAEVTHIPGETAQLVVSCICIVNPFDNGRCYGCRSGMKHPNAAAYFGGLLDVAQPPCFPLGGLDPDKTYAPCGVLEGTEDDALKNEEARLRHLFKGLGDPKSNGGAHQTIRPEISGY